MRDFNSLRLANIARQIEWTGIDLSDEFRALELAGETGEACNVVKKLVRERLGVQGSRATIQDLADELADVVICVDLLAQRYGIDVAMAVENKFNQTSRERKLRTRLYLQHT